jgi:hypothetical protein
VATLLFLAVLAACADPQGPLDPHGGGRVGAQQLRIPVTGTYSQVTAGNRYTCALRTDGVVECWGFSFSGAAPASRTAATGYFTAVDAFSDHTCALRSDGAAECWGNEPTGTVVPPAGTTFLQVRAGVLHSCALRSDGVAQCWGTNDDGQAPPTRAATSGTFTALGAAGRHTCGLNTAGVIECWGHHSTSVPSSLTASSGVFTQVVTTNFGLCGIRSDLLVECATGGTLLEGSLANLDLYDHYKCATRTDGVVVCAGTNSWGPAPAEWHATTGSFTTVTVGYEHWCALRNDGVIECGGEKRAGAFTLVSPTATFTAPASVIVGQTFELSLSNAQVPGYPAATQFTYAFDCGSGLTAASTSSTASCPSTVAGTLAVRGLVIDQDGDAGTYSASVLVKTASEGTIDLQAEIDAASLSPDLRKALLSKLNAALDAIAKGKVKPACAALSDFINQVNAQRGKAIPEATADAWILTATQLQAAIGC